MGILAALALFAAGASNGVVLKPVASMYSQPTEDADVVSQAIYGSHVGILERKGDWARVRTADDYTGWMPMGSLREEARVYAAGGRVAQVESLFAHLYREPDVTKHQPLLTVPFESRLEVIAEPPNGERWLEVRLVDDRAGWVQRGDIAFEPKKLSIEETIALARKFLGVPYTWGGASSFGFDCSGFMQTLCRRRGYNLPRDAAPQARWNGVAPVERKDLRPGDLLYFGPSPEKITHTGMYIGNGLFINATTWQTPAVRIDDLNDAHWARLIVAQRRLK